MQREEETQHLVGGVDPQPDQGHQQPGASVVREWGAASRHAAAGSAGAGQRVLAVVGVGGGELLVERLEVGQGEAAQAGEGGGADGQELRR